jgi:hypothetical protein
MRMTFDFKEKFCHSEISRFQGLSASIRRFLEATFEMTPADIAKKTTVSIAR